MVAAIAYVRFKKKWIVSALAKVIVGGFNKFLESCPLSGLIKGGRVEFCVKFFGKYLTKVEYFVVKVISNIICSTSSMFSTAFSSTWPGKFCENGKIPPFYYLRESILIIKE